MFGKRLTRKELEAQIKRINGDREKLKTELDVANGIINSSKFKRAEQLSDEEMERQQGNAEQVLFLKVEVMRLKRSINHVIGILNDLVQPDCTTDLSDELMDEAINRKKFDQ